MTLLGGIIIMLFGLGVFLGGIKLHDWSEKPNDHTFVPIPQFVASFFGPIIAFLGFMMFIIPPLFGLSVILQTIARIGG